MPEEIKVVKPDSTTGGVNGDSPAPDDLVKTKADNERLKGALSSLQTERDEIRGKLERLEEIENKRSLSEREEAQRRSLERKDDTLDDQIDQLRRKPEAKPWFSHLEREVAKATKLGASEAILVLAADFLEESAEDLSGKDEFKGLTDEKLLKLIKPYMSQFETKSALRKTKLAFKAWQEDQAFKKEKAESAKKKAEESLSAENGGRVPRETTTQEVFNKQNLSVSDKAMLREKLGIMTKAR